MTGDEYNHINDVIQDLYQDGRLGENDFDFLCETIDKADRCDKYRWHDLRDNPEDLPKDFKRSEYYDWILIRLDCGKIYMGWFRDDDKDFYIEDGCGGRFANRVVAWREIEPFEEMKQW